MLELPPSKGKSQKAQDVLEDSSDEEEEKMKVVKPAVARMSVKIAKPRVRSTSVSSKADSSSPAKAGGSSPVKVKVEDVVEKSDVEDEDQGDMPIEIVLSR